MNSNQKSHIQLSKGVLRYFSDNKSGKLLYYNFEDKRFHKSSISNFNTEKGFYSETGEEFLNKNLETPLGELLKKIKHAYNNNQKELFLEPEESLILIKYPIVTLNRNEHEIEKIANRAESRMFFTEQKLHDNCIELADLLMQTDNSLNNFEVKLLFNRTKIPFLLPQCGIGCNTKSKECHFYSPITPQISIFLYQPILKNNNSSEFLFEQNNVINITNKKCIEKINFKIIETAKRFEPPIVISQDWSYLRQIINNE